MYRFQIYLSVSTPCDRERDQRPHFLADVKMGRPVGYSCDIQAVNPSTNQCMSHSCNPTFFPKTTSLRTTPCSWLLYRRRCIAPDTDDSPSNVYSSEPTSVSTNTNGYMAQQRNSFYDILPIRVPPSRRTPRACTHTGLQN